MKCESILYSHEKLTLNCSFWVVLSKSFKSVWILFWCADPILNQSSSVICQVENNENKKKPGRIRSWGTVIRRSAINFRPGLRDTVIFAAFDVRSVEFFVASPKLVIVIVLTFQIECSLVIKSFNATVLSGIGSKTTWNVKIVCSLGPSDRCFTKIV